MILSMVKSNAMTTAVRPTTEPILLCNDSNRWKSKAHTNTQSRSKIVDVFFSIFHSFCMISSRTLLSLSFYCRFAVEQAYRCLCKRENPFALLHLVPLFCVRPGDYLIICRIKGGKDLNTFCPGLISTIKRQHMNVLSLEALIKLSHFILTCISIIFIVFSWCFCWKFNQVRNVTWTQSGWRAWAVTYTFCIVSRTHMIRFVRYARNAIYFVNIKSAFFLFVQQVKSVEIHRHWNYIAWQQSFTFNIFHFQFQLQSISFSLCFCISFVALRMACNCITVCARMW